MLTQLYEPPKPAKPGFGDDESSLDYEWCEQFVGRMNLFTRVMSRSAGFWPDGKVFDLVGNLDEWVEDSMFLGGFYARSTTKGCDAQISSHAQNYFDYSTGTRCCQNLD